MILSSPVRRFGKLLAAFLAILILFFSVRYVFFKPAQVFADSLFTLNEGYGSSVNDNNGNVTAGTITGAVWKTSEFCRDDKCLYFDGAGDLVSFADDADLDFVAADDFTITGWFRHPIIATNPDYLVAKHQSATAGGYKVYMDSDGDMVFGIDDDGTWDTTDIVGDDQSKNFDDNKWHHFAAQKDDTTGIYLYVDGNLIDSDTSLVETGTLANAASFYIGIDADGTSNGWSGFIDEVKVYRSLRTAAEIKADYLKETPSRGISASFGPDTSYLSNGLIGYWKMDETAANSCGTNDSCDSSGNANDGAWNGSTANTTGKYGNGTSYDGTADYTSVADSTSLHLNDFTIESWYKTTTTSVTQGLVSKRTSFATMDWELYLSSDGNIYMQIGESSGDTLFGSCAYAANTWQHVAAVKSGTTFSLYLNGTYCKGDTSAVTWTDSDGLALGALTTSGSNSLNGTLDNVRIYNRALTPAEVARLYNFAPGPVGHWKMDENTGTSTTNDSSGNGNTGTMNGTMTSSDWTAGKYGSALDFDGTDDYVSDTSVTWDFTGTTTKSFSLGSWFKPDSCSDGIMLSNDAGLTIQISGTSWIFQLKSGGTFSIKSASCVVGTWIHVEGVYDADSTTLFLYLNGVLVDSDVVSSVDTSTLSDQVNIGRSSFAGYFDGLIDDVRVYNYPRTAGQIIEDMNAGHPAPGSPIGSAVAHWKFDEGYGTTANDNSINSNALTLSTASWTNSGKFGKAFNGLTNVRLSRTTDPDLEFSATEDFTLSLWYKSDSATNPSAIEYLVNDGAAAGSAGYAIYANTDGTVCFGIDDDVTWGPDVASCTTTDVYDNTWHHITAVRNVTSDTTKIYLDAVEKDSDTDTTTATLDSSPTFYIGDANATDGTDEFLGDIDEAKIFRSALTADAIKILYNQNVGQSLGSLSTDASNNPSNSSTDSYCPPGEGVSCTAPKLEWKLDENTGTSNFDTSGNGATGVWTGTPQWVSGKQGSALHFNGSTDLLKYTPTSWTCSTSGCTVSLWVKADRTGQAQYSASFASSDAGSAANTFQLDIGGAAGCSGMYRLYGQDSAAVAFPVCFDTYTTNWIHLLVTVTTTGTITTYMNGVYKNQSTPASGFTGSFARYKLGQSRGGSDFFAGNIDQVKVYDRVLTQQEIAWDYNRGAPVGWWKLDECTGTTIYDASTIGGKNGTWSGAAGSNTSAGTCTTVDTATAWYNGRNGKYNGSLDFDNTDDNIDMNDQNDLDFADGESFAIAAWINRASFGTDDTIVSKKLGQLSTTAGYTLWVDDATDDLRLAVSDGDSTNLHVVNSTTAFTAAGWHHVVVVYDDSGASASKIYVDGKDDTATNTTTGTFSSIASLANTVDFRIGSQSNDDIRFDGQIDDVRIYRYPLTPQQIKTVINQGAVNFAPVTGSP